jgi:hypothetical protein
MKKYAPYILILIIVLVGLFSPIRKVGAVACTSMDETGTQLPIGCTEATTPTTTDPNQLIVEKSVDPTVNPTPKATGAAPDPDKSEFDNWATEESCGIIGESSVAGCTKALFYYIVYTPSAVILAIAATFFNALISISLSSDLFSASSSFISTAWGVVRDLSNIFFILILLYIAIKIILGLGGSEVKKMIAKVIIIALLINFSMFFTQMIIDTSNILALIFYNKLEVTYKDPNTGQPIARPYNGATGSTEKDLSGSMYSGFDVTKKLNDPTFWESTKTPTDSTGKLGTTADHVPVGTMIGIIVVGSAIMLFAAYCFFVSGLAFVARLIELFILIIFSPFAFMSSTIPLLSSIERLGWDAWFKRLLTASFMAPIFMFFMYLIVLLLSKNLFGSLIKPNTSWIQTMLGFLIPGILILVLLLEATKFAKKGSGAIGEMVMKGAKMVGGVALGATVGTVAVAGRATIGRAGSAMANSQWAKKWEAGHFGGEATMAGFKKMGSGSFDARGASIGGKTLASATGMNLGKAQEGGFTGRREKDIKKRQERAKEIEVGEDESLKQALNKTEANLQGLLGANAKEIDTLDKTIEKKRQEAADAERDFKAGTITKAQLQAKTNELKNAKDNKTDFRKGNDYMTTDSSGVASIKKGTGVNIDTLERLKKDQTQDIKTENVSRREAYAKKLEGGGNRAWNFVFSGGQYALKRGTNEAAHKVRMETKLDSGTKT